MSKPDTSLCRKIFDELDTDHSGKLNIDELVTGLNKQGAGVTKDEVQEIINLMDEGERDGELNFKEFCQFVYVCENADMEKGASILFYLTDADFSGLVDQTEFFNIMKKLGEDLTKEEIAAFFNDNCCPNGMTYETFMTWFDE